MSRLFTVLLAILPLSAAAHDLDRSAERVDVLEVAASESDQVRMSSSNGSLVVRVDDTLDRAVLEAEVSASAQTRADAERDLERIHVVFERQGDVLVAEADIPKDVHGGASFVLRVPGARGADLDTDNGGVEVVGIHGDVTVDTANGGVEVRRTDGQVTIRTRNGRVEVVDADGDVNATSSNGRVEVRDVGGSVSATTSNGSIEVVLRPDAAGPVNLVTSNGSIRLEVGPAFNGKLKTGTSFGSVKVYDASGRAISRGDVWQIGDGGEESRAESSMGSVSVHIGG